MHPDGYVEIRDRFKDVIISGGENISSVEVEGVLLRHPAGAGGRRSSACRTRSGARAPHAFVVLAAGAVAPTEERPRSSRATALAHFKAPHAVTFVAELPKTATGKIQKYALRRAGRRSRQADRLGRHSPRPLDRVGQQRLERRVMHAQQGWHQRHLTPSTKAPQDPLDLSSRQAAHSRA